jgi:ABC-type nitrate/sulfonate/bicarbonate transport system permease component
MRRRAAIIRTAILLGVLVVWELVARSGLVNRAFLPAPSAVVGSFGELTSEPRAVYGFQITAYRLFWAFVIGTGAGIAMGLILGLWRTLRGALLPPILFVLSTPKAVFLPIFLLLFGLGSPYHIAYGAFSAFFYVVDNVVGGVDLLEDRHRRLATAFRAPARHYLLDVVVPSAAPGIFSGVWHGLRQALAAVLVAELFAADAGVGFMIRIYTTQFRADKSLAIVAVLSIVSILAGAAWNRLESRMNRWRIQNA